MLVAGVATRAELIAPSEGFAWIGSEAALVAFAVATMIEAIAYYVPWLDNLLDVIASPIAVIAGILLSAALLGDVSPLMQWSLAVIAGGGAAAAVQGGTVVTRLASTASTGGTANPILTTFESIVSFVLAALSVLVPIVAVCLLLIALVVMYYTGRKVLGRWFGRGDVTPAVDADA